jgi:ribosomal protein L19E
MTPEDERAMNRRKPTTSTAAGGLRRRAEARLGGRQSGPKSEAGTRRLLHELEVHQIELEMQNAELQKARDDLEVALEKYTDLYDFAPVGYFSLD